MFVDGGREEALANRFTARASQSFEGFPFIRGCRLQVALAGELGVAQNRRGAQERFDLAAVLADEPVHGGGGHARFAERLDLVSLRASSCPSQLACCLIAHVRELRERQPVQLVDDLIGSHLVIFAERSPPLQSGAIRRQGRSVLARLGLAATLDIFVTLTTLSARHRFAAAQDVLRAARRCAPR